MKININGITREMSAEEVAAYEKVVSEMPAPEPTPEELMRQEIAYLREALELILSGVTEVSDNG